ncbi:MAG: hypothetical protein WBA93_00025, partial [Microcoleaceae cyanobacterium]
DYSPDSSHGETSVDTTQQDKSVLLRLFLADQRYILMSDNFIVPLHSRLKFNPKLSAYFSSKNSTGLL